MSSNTSRRELTHIAVFVAVVSSIAMLSDSGVTLNFLMMALYAALLAQAWNILGGLMLGESLGQIGIFVIFIAVLLFRPQGLFGAKA